MKSLGNLGTLYAKEETGKERRTRLARKSEAWLVLENAPLHLFESGGCNESRDLCWRGYGPILHSLRRYFCDSNHASASFPHAVQGERDLLRCTVSKCQTAVHRSFGAAHSQKPYGNMNAQRWALKTKESGLRCGVSSGRGAQRIGTVPSRWSLPQLNLVRSLSQGCYN